MLLKIFNNIEKHISLSTEERELVTSKLKHDIVERNDFLLHQNDKCPYIFFVNSGLLRAYFIDNKGKEATIMFAIADWWITDIYSFLNDKPAFVSIQAVERTDYIKLAKRDLDDFYIRIPQFNKLFRILMQNSYGREQMRMMQNLSLPAKIRYENFLAKYPEIALKVPLKHIASYLGITPEFLSAIRAKKY